jgi:hypothetical protein
VAKMLDGVLDRLLIDVSGLEGIEFTAWIEGKPHVFSAPIISKEGRSKVIKMLDKALGTRVSIIAHPPTGMVFQTEFDTFQIC